MIPGSVIYLAGVVKEIKSGKETSSITLNCNRVKFLVSGNIS